METILTLLGMLMVLLYAILWIAGPILLTAWVRNRREETIKRQIALTDAIHENLGAIVSPEVQKPLWGPWQIRIAVPFTQPAVVGRILTVVDGMLSASSQMQPGRYQIILTSMEESLAGKRQWSPSQPVERWSRGAMAA